MYDFHKVPHLQQGVLIAESEHEIWEFSNPHFQRGRPDLLVLVTRKRNREKDTIDTENISMASLVSDLSTIKKHQNSIGTDLRDLQRDNEILWQETLNAREKYQRHQEAIEKIIQFLTTIFSNDRLAISMSKQIHTIFSHFT
jgi:heat shock transcription factor